MRNFFVKSGRPSKEEKALAIKIESLIKEAEQKNDAGLLKKVDEAGAVYNLDGLKKLYNTLTGNNNSNNNNNNDTTMSNKNKNNKDDDFENPSSENEESVEFEETLDNQTESPLQQPVIERQDEISKFQQEHGMGGEEGEGYGEEREGEEEFEEPRTGGGFSGDSGGGSQKDDDDDDNVGGNLGDIPPHTKNKAINSTAEVITKIYAGVVPILPKMLAKVPKKKIDRLAWNDEINLDMRLDMGLDPNGRRMITTVGRYIDDYNDMVEDQMALDEQQQEDFKKCLKAVLAEKQVAMTPTQQLTAVMISHLAGFLVMGIQNNISMRRNLEYWKERHEENKAKRSGGGQKPPQKPSPPPPPKPDDKPHQTDKTPPSSNGKDIKHDEDDIPNETDEISIDPEKVKS